MPCIAPVLSSAVSCLSNSVTSEQNPSRVAVSSSASPHIPQTLWTTVLRFCVNNSLPTIPILSQIKPSHNLISYLRSMSCYYNIYI